MLSNFSLSSALLLSALVLLLATLALWKLQRWVWAAPAAKRLPLGLLPQMEPSVAAHLITFLIGTMALLFLGGLGWAAAWMMGSGNPLSSQGVSAVLVAAFSVAAFSLLTVTAVSRRPCLRLVVRIFGRVQAFLVAIALSLAAFSACDWGWVISHGPSMEPSLPSSVSLGVVDTSAYRRLPPALGDIVTFRGSAKWPPGAYNKRVVGVPGDVFHFALDQVWENGVPLVGCKEGGKCFITLGRTVSYPVKGSAVSFPRVIRLHKGISVEPGHYFVLGDNLPVSGDSRFYGTVPAYSIQGQVVAVLGWNGWKRVSGGSR